MNTNRYQLVCILLTIALFLSDFFVVLTPLPLIYGFLRLKTSAFKAVVLPSFGLLVGLYVVVLPQLYPFYQENPGWSWLLPFPAMNLIQFYDLTIAICFGIGYFVLYIVCAYIVSFVVAMEDQTLPLMIKSSLVLAGVALVCYSFYTLAIGMGPLAFLKDYFGQVLNEVIGARQAQDLPEMALLKENVDSILRYSTTFSAAASYCWILFVLLVNLLLARKLFSSLLAEVKITKLNVWSPPFYMVWMVVGCLALLLANSVVLSSNVVLALAGNTLIVLCFGYYLQGLNIISFFLDQKKVKPLPRVLIYAFIVIFFQPLSFIVLSAGFFDSWFDFRKIAQQA